METLPLEEGHPVLHLHRIITSVHVLPLQRRRAFFVGKWEHPAFRVLTGGDISCHDIAVYNQLSVLVKPEVLFGNVDLHIGSGQIIRSAALIVQRISIAVFRYIARLSGHRLFGEDILFQLPALCILVNGIALFIGGSGNSNGLSGTGCKLSVQISGVVFGCQA